MKRIIKNIFVTLFVFTMMASGAFASELQFDQDDVITSFERYQGGNLEPYVIRGNDDVTFSQTISFNGSIWEYDKRFEFEALNNPVIIYFDNNDEGTEINFLWNTEGIGIEQDFRMLETGRYYFRLVPTNTGESTSLYINLTDSTDVMNLFIIEEKVRSFSRGVDMFIDCIVDIMMIILATWKLMYYIFVFIIIVAIIGSMIGFGFKIVEWAERFSEKRRKNVYNRRVGRE